MTTPNSQIKTSATQNGLASLTSNQSPKTKKITTVARLTPKNHSSRKILRRAGAALTFTFRLKAEAVAGTEDPRRMRAQRNMNQFGARRLGKRRAKSPLFFSARGRRNLLASSAKKPRGWSAAWRIQQSALGEARASFGKGRAPRGAPSRLASQLSAATQAPGPRFLGRGCHGGQPFQPVPVQQAPCGAVLMPPGRGPGASREQGYEPCPQAPHPPPPSFASHENALGMGRISRNIVQRSDAVKRQRKRGLDYPKPLSRNHHDNDKSDV